MSRQGVKGRVIGQTIVRKICGVARSIDHADAGENVRGTAPVKLEIGARGNVDMTGLAEDDLATYGQHRITVYEHRLGVAEGKRGQTVAAAGQNVSVVRPVHNPGYRWQGHF